VNLNEIGKYICAPTSGYLLHGEFGTKQRSLDMHDTETYVLLEGEGRGVFTPKFEEKWKICMWTEECRAQQKIKVG